MKWFTLKKWVVFCLCFFLVIGQGSMLWAEPMEEEEEPVQTMPNPMEKTTIQGRGINSVKGGQVNWDPTDTKVSGQKTQIKQQTGRTMSNKIPSSAAGGKAARPGAAMKSSKSMK